MATMRSYQEITARYDELAHLTVITPALEEELLMLSEIAGTEPDEMMSIEGVFAYFFDNYSDGEWVDLARRVENWILNRK